MEQNNDPEQQQRNEQLEKLRRLAEENGLLGDAVHLNALLNSKRPKIMVPGDQRELIDFAKECGAEFAKEDRLFRRDRTVVTVNHEKQRLEPLTPRAMRSFAQRFIIFYKFKTVDKDDERSTITVVKNITAETAGALLESWEMLEQLPEIERLNQTRLPVVRKDGRIELLRPGYFAEQRIYTLDDGLLLDEEMSLKEAKRIIDWLLKYFPFPNERSRAVAVAAMLTMFCTAMLPPDARRPGFIYNANAPGAGKTLLAQVAIIPVVGSCTIRTLPRKEEAKKVLDGIALDAESYALFDNIRTRIQGEELEAFITSPTWGGRVLGELTKFRVPNVATIFLTGNDTSNSDDMQERCLYIELFVQEADNRERVKKITTLIDAAWLSAPQNRAKILSALWAFVRHWDASGRPKPPSHFPRFEDWSRIVAGVVIAAGYEDPLTVPELKNFGAVEGREMRELVRALAPRVPITEAGPADAESQSQEQIDVRAGADAEWTFREIIEKVVALGLFSDLEVRRGRSVEDMFQDGEMTPAGRSHFGKLLVKYNRRIYAIEGALMRFIVEGKGNQRKFRVICEQAPMPESNETETDESAPF